MNDAPIDGTGGRGSALVTLTYLLLVTFSRDVYNSGGERCSGERRVGKTVSAVLYRFYRFCEWLASWLPRRAAYATARVTGVAMFIFYRKLRRTLVTNQRRLLPDASRRQVAHSARRAAIAVAKNYYDLFRLPSMSQEQLLAYFDVRGHGESRASLCARQRASSSSRRISAVTISSRRTSARSATRRSLSSSISAIRACTSISSACAPIRASSC